LDRGLAASRYRTTDAGQAVESRGELLGTDVDGAVTGAAELVKKINVSPSASACMVNQFFRLAYGRLESQADDCGRRALISAYQNAGGSIKAAMLAVVRSDMFRHKRFD
jgi:hypothetical protein